MFLVLRLIRADNLFEPLESPLPIDIRVLLEEDDPMGYCPVFETYEAALVYAKQPELVIEIQLQSEAGGVSHE